MHEHRNYPFQTNSHTCHSISKLLNTTAIAPIKKMNIESDMNILSTAFLLHSHVENCSCFFFLFLELQNIYSVHKQKYAWSKVERAFLFSSLCIIDFFNISFQDYNAIITFSNLTFNYKYEGTKSCAVAVVFPWEHGSAWLKQV